MEQYGIRQSCVIEVCWIDFWHTEMIRTNFIYIKYEDIKQLRQQISFIFIYLFVLLYNCVVDHTGTLKKVAVRDCEVLVF